MALKTENNEPNRCTIMLPLIRRYRHPPLTQSHRSQMEYKHGSGSSINSFNPRPTRPNPNASPLRSIHTLQSPFNPNSNAISSTALNVTALSIHRIQIKYQGPCPRRNLKNSLFSVSSTFERSPCDCDLMQRELDRRN